MAVGALIEQLNGMDPDMDITIKVYGKEGSESYMVDGVDTLGVRSLVIMSAELDQTLGPVQDSWTSGPGTRYGTGTWV